MIAVRKSAERGTTALDWLDSKHSFSFGDYYDPQNMGFKSLRVINEDVVAPGAGFGMHPHKDMEILTYVLDGDLEHRDSLGSGSVIRHGKIQRMTAGRGILHSEFNHSKTTPVHLLQIWLLPERRGLQPSYEEADFSLGGGLTLLAAPEGQGGAVTIHQNVKLYAGTIAAGAEVKFEVEPGRALWIQVAKGKVAVNGTAAEQGDGVTVADERAVAITAAEEAEVLLFDLQ